MMLVTITPENREIEVREGFRLALPKFLWTVLEARAQVLHQGDLEKTVMELVGEELMGWFQQASRKMVPLPTLSLN